MLLTILLKAMIVHTVTYFVVGITAFKIFNYNATFARRADYLRPVDSPLVRAGLLFQPIRGLLFGIVFYLLGDVLFQHSDGWFIMWVMLVVVGVLSTFAPAPISIEGFIFLKPSPKTNWGGLVEILTQSFLLSVITYYWVNHPEYLWFNWIFGILFIVALLLPALGLLATNARPQPPAHP